MARHLSGRMCLRGCVMEPHGGGRSCNERQGSKLKCSRPYGRRVWRAMTVGRARSTVKARGEKNSEAPQRKDVPAGLRHGAAWWGPTLRRTAWVEI